ncbi:PREDICTED: uncharacterized protein LOC104813673 [Tarenaya hassleriana]|uniref:uncharacterized protein LOC104813673 n=1 Tax=Tarenaya hassleriana TaxID=28532 RepID=UPI00053CA6A6|nr:PREDICTED: uncharacterized protein LOC104813673 [Tarenaya hassleriana]
MAETQASSGGQSIVFTTLGRPSYEFDIFTLPTRHRSPPSDSGELRITDGVPVNFNGHFAYPSAALISLLPNNSGIQPHDQSYMHLIYITERNGTSSVYYDAVSGDHQVTSRLQVPVISGANRLSGMAVNSMKDKPSLAGDYLVYVSTHEVQSKPMTSWAAVYSTELRTGSTRRLTPPGIADFSPAVSPSGNWTAVASYGERGWNGELEELSTDIYVFLTRDGTQRVKVVEHGGWPCWVDESTLYFHRRSEEDGWMSVYRAILPKNGSISTESVTIQRVTPPGIHAFTPATSPNNHDFIAVATRRPGSDIRHVELFDLKRNDFIELTRLVSPKSHHFNPFLSPDSTRVGYHSCRGEANGQTRPSFLLENIKSSSPDLSLFRIEGGFPSFSSAGDRIAFVTYTGVFVVNSDATNPRQIFGKMTFSTAWDPIRPGTVYTSSGPILASVKTQVDIIAIDVDAVDQSKAVRNLTTNGQNNAFPWPSPDGKRIVFRSSMSGNKNLYIMDAEKGETGGLFRLTDGAWNDTMCSWSPDGDWIAFASNRENPGTESFGLFLIHPNGTGLRKLTETGLGRMSNHPVFSPDGKTVAFTSNYAAISAEPISNPDIAISAGEIFTVKLDGSDLSRVTHNSYMDGTPIWAPKFIQPADVAWPKRTRPSCTFQDCQWLKKPLTAHKI